jgi:pimeloyl-ACP methyl ester carboxylesterase
MASIGTGEAEVHYEDDGTGVPVVMLHGFPGRPQDFRWLVTHMAESFRLLRPALPGMGITPAAGEAGDVEGMARFVLAWLDSLGIGEAVFLAHSASGAAAARIAATHPDRCLALAMLSSIGPVPHRMFRRSRPDLGRRLMASPAAPLLMPLIRMGFRSAGFPRGITDQTILGSMEYAGSLSFGRFREDLSRVRCPSAVIWAADDPLIEAEVSIQLERLLPEGPRIRLDTGGHNPQKIHAERISGELSGWLQKQSRQRIQPAPPPEVGA